VRYHEIGRPNAETLHWDKQNASDEKGKIKEELDIVIPRPLVSMWWRQLMRGDFVDAIYDNAAEMWQLVEDWNIVVLIKNLTDKQKEVLFLSAVRLCTAAQIACYHDKTDRAIRKLLATALHFIRDKLAPLVQKQIEIGFPQMTLAKREFLVRYDKEKAALDSSKDR
jgi:DNA-directed RNA polymerase specialized sigma24 family protein